MKILLEIAQKKIILQRYPVNKNQTLQAWNAADEYLIAEVEQLPQQLKSKILILNDSFGALSCAMNKESLGQKLVCSSDSLLSQLALKKNLKNNQLNDGNILVQNSLQQFPADISLVILKIPKSLAMLEYLLIKIAQEIKPNVKIIASSMVKDLHASSLKLFEKIIGPTTTSLAKKKARLVYCQTRENSSNNLVQPYPKVWEVELPEKILHITNHANVFSMKGLDVGTRFMLENFPQGEFQNIIDLGCGNGVLGLTAKLFFPKAKISFVDESYMAVDSAKTNWEKNFPGLENPDGFKVSDCLQEIPKNSADLIVCNPPFHQQQTITDEIAMQMFSESAEVLKKHGRIIIVGNRHLGYHLRLKRWFKNIEQLAANKKFVIFSALEPNF